MAEKYMVNKENLKFEKGYLVDGYEIVGMPTDVALQLNKLELMVQQYDYLKAQPEGKYVPMPSLAGFERKSALHKGAPHIEEPETPFVDAKLAEGLRFAAEIDALDDARCINEQLDKFAALFEWIDADKFAEGEWLEPLDLPTLGNPLELKPEDIVAVIRHMAENPVAFNGAL